MEKVICMAAIIVLMGGLAALIIWTVAQVRGEPSEAEARRRLAALERREEELKKEK